MQIVKEYVIIALRISLESTEKQTKGAKEKKNGIFTAI